jgi:hypothetical protein
MNFRWFKKHFLRLVQLLDMAQPGTRKLLLFILMAITFGGLLPSWWVTGSLLGFIAVWHTLEAFTVRPAGEKKDSLIEAIFGIGILSALQLAIWSNPITLTVAVASAFAFATRMTYTRGLTLGKAERKRLEELEKAMALDDIDGSDIEATLEDVATLIEELGANKKSFLKIQDALRERAAAEKALKAADRKRTEAALELKKRSPTVVSIASRLTDRTARTELDVEIDALPTDTNVEPDDPEDDEDKAS